MNKEEFKLLLTKEMRKVIERQEKIIQAFNRQIEKISADENEEDIEEIIVNTYCPSDFGLDMRCCDFPIDEENEEECCRQCWRTAYKSLKRED